MGTPALSPAATSYFPIRSDFPGGGTAPVLLSQRPTPQRDVAALLQPNQEQALTEAFESAVYRSLESRQQLSVQYSDVRGRLAQNGDDSSQVEFQSTQLQFDFFSETRYEELALFNQRTNGVGEGLEGPRQDRFFATREEVATRFQLSISISGAALNGFAGAAEGAQDLIDRLLDITEKLLGQADDLFSDFFSLLDGAEGEFSAESLNELFNAFVSDVLDTFSEEFLSGLGLPNDSGDNPIGTNATSTAVQLEFSFEFSASVTSTQAVVEQGDPIVFDLDGDGIELSTYQNGARFDLIGAGSAQQVAFVQGGDAFLALDRNGDGKINSGLELFGEQHGARNGFEELKRFDGNRDGIIDRNDAVFTELRLFRDNGNGETEAGELLSLLDAGINAIQLDYQDVNERAAGGNRITQVASYLRNDGGRGQVADALLNYLA